MSILVRQFPRIGDALVDALPAILATRALPGVKAGTVTPKTLDTDAVTGFLRITVTNDPRGRISRRATVDIESFATRRTLAYDLAEEVDVVVTTAHRIGGVTIDDVETSSGPKQVPWDDNSAIRRFIATYRIATRR